MHMHSETTNHLRNIDGVATAGPESGQLFPLIMSTLLMDTRKLPADQPAFSYDWRWTVTFHRIIFPYSAGSLVTPTACHMIRKTQN